MVFYDPFERNTSLLKYSFIVFSIINFHLEFTNVRFKPILHHVYELKNSVDFHLITLSQKIIITIAPSN